MVIEQRFPQEFIIDKKCTTPHVIGTTSPKTLFLNQQLQPRPIFGNDLYLQSIPQATKPIIVEQPIVTDKCTKSLVIEQPGMRKPYVIENKLAQPLPQQFVFERQPQEQSIFIRQDYPYAKTCPRHMVTADEMRPVYLASQSRIPVQQQGLQQQITVEKDNIVGPKSGSSTVTLLNVGGVPNPQNVIETVVVEPDSTPTAVIEEARPVIYYQPKSYLTQPNFIQQRYF